MTELECPLCGKESSDHNNLANHINDWHFRSKLNDAQFDYLTEHKIPVELDGMMITKKGEGIPLITEKMLTKTVPKIINNLKEIKLKTIAAPVEKNDEWSRKWKSMVNYDSILDAAKTLFKKFGEEGAGRVVTAREVRYYFYDKIGIPHSSKQFSVNAQLVFLREKGKLELIPMNKDEMRKWCPDKKPSTRIKKIVISSNLKLDPMTKEEMKMMRSFVKQPENTSSKFVNDPLYVKIEFSIGQTRIGVDGNLATHLFMHKLILDHKDEIMRLSG
jgi:hypothetical protein